MEAEDGGVMAEKSSRAPCCCYLPELGFGHTNGMGWVEGGVQPDPIQKILDLGGIALLVQLEQGHLTPTQYIEE